MFVLGRVADWVAYNLAAVDEKVLATIAVLSADGLRPDDNLDALLYGGKILAESDKDNILACIQMSRCSQVQLWVKEIKQSSLKYPTKISFDDFSKLFFQLAQFDCHQKFVHDKPVDAWIDLIVKGTEKCKRIAHLYEQD